MDKEQLQFNALLEQRAVAIGLDASSISDDTRQRVAAMLKSRRDRMMEEEREFLDSLKNEEATATFTREIAVTLNEDELTSRTIIKKQEEKAFDRLVKVFDEQFQHLSAGMLTVRQQKEIEASRARKIKALETDLNRERFYLYWDMHQKQRDDMLRHGVGGSAGSPFGSSSSKKQQADPNSQEAQMHRMTAVLRRAYENSAPQFATDPEELWKRGQALPPTAATSTTIGSQPGEFDLPAYHELGKKLRDQYRKHQSQNGVGASIANPNNNNNNGASPFKPSQSGSPFYRKPKSSAKYPMQQDSPFKTAIHTALDQYLS